MSSRFGTPLRACRRADLSAHFAAPSSRPLATLVPLAGRCRSAPTVARVLLPGPRSFSSTRPARAALATHPPAHPTVLLAAPTPEALEDLEVDVEPIPAAEAKLLLTDRAAEQLRSIATRESNSDLALRIAVEAGGCHGYQYKMDVADGGRAEEDYVFAHPKIQPSNVLVDAVSLALLKGSTIDFATELIGSSFRVLDNPQAKGAGCGCGVSWEAKF